MDAMPLRDMLFWFFITIFGTGTFVIFEKHVVWGTTLIVIGLTGMVGCAWPYFKSQPTLAHYPNSRTLLTAGFLTLSLCLLLALATPDLHQRLRGWIGFAAVGLAGAILSCGFWWVTGRMLVPASTPGVIYITDPKMREEIQRMRAEIYRAKAVFLESPEVYHARVAKDNLRKVTEGVEKEVGCLIDMTNLECLPKPPQLISSTELEINTPVTAVADEISQSRFWVVRRTNRSKFRVPIVLFLSVTNRHEEPIKIDLMYLEASSSSEKWADIRMADSLPPPSDVKTMDSAPLVMESKDDYGQMRGVPFTRVVQPSDSAWGYC